ncbi:MAG: hypothetical protein KDD22_04880 [Bdellovibrionales bacterium]|nr:hypothetical protein [Bdellovibrionales bacterium]
MKKLIGATLCVIGSMNLMACSSGMQSTPLSSVTGQTGFNNINNDKNPNSNNTSQLSDDELVQMEKVVTDATEDAELAIQEAQAALDQILDENGNVKILSDSVDVGQAHAQLFVSGKLEEALGKVKLLLDGIPKAFEVARNKLADAIAKLDANNPAHQALLSQAMLLMSKIDQMEAHVKSLKAVLVKKLNVVIKQLNQVIKKMQSNIAGAILSIELSDIRDVLVRFRNSIK